MILFDFIARQLMQIRKRGWEEFERKLKLATPIILRLPLTPLAVFVVLIIRLIRPFYLVRIGRLTGWRMGHFAANVELYLCERDAGINTPDIAYLGIWYHPCEPCNLQLDRMWRRVLFVGFGPLFTIVDQINLWIPGGEVHQIPATVKSDRDVHHLLDRFPAHLKFTAKEEEIGDSGLRALGIPCDAKFICLTVRDSAYLDAQAKAAHAKVDRSYHNYRDCDVNNFILAATELAERGYYVVRMGAVVREAMKVSHPRIVDYATNGMRSDFMDIYLGAKCEFCISTSTGFDAIPYVFRRPIVYVNSCPLGGTLSTFREKFINITKHHFSIVKKRDLTLTEIFAEGGGFCLRSSQYESLGIQLLENTPEEIRDVVMEMVERLNGTWIPHEEDEILQKRFWEKYSNALDVTGNRHLHGELRSRFGTNFLRQNKDFLE